MRLCYMNSWLCESGKSEADPSNWVVYRLDREYEAVCPFFDDPYRINLSNYYHFQIYKSRWSLSKCLYLVCRFGLLLCWPIIMYAFMFDHDVESCKPFLLIVSILFMLFVRPALLFVTHKLTANFTLPTRHASLNVYMSFVHMQSQEQNAGRCSFICPASLPTSLSSSGILWAECHSGKKSF